MTIRQALATLVLLGLLPPIAYAAWTEARSSTQPPELTVEDLGPMALKASVTLGPLVPDRTGTGFVQLLYAFPPGDYRTTREPFEIVAVDLQTGRLTRASAGKGPGSVGWQVWSSAWGSDGKLYLGTNGPPHLISWDPKTQTAEDQGLVWEGVECVYSLVTGTDGALYGGGCNTSTAFRYDPKTKRIEDLGVLGLPRTYKPAYAYSIAADHRYVYMASGKIPWYVVAYDRQTRKQENLLTFDQRDFPQVIQYPDAVYARVSIAAKDGQPARSENYRLAGGKAYPVAAVPAPSARITPVPVKAPPYVFLDTSAASRDGKGRLWYRPAGQSIAPRPAPTGAGPEQLGWKSNAISVVVEPFQVRRLALLPDGRILGATGPYGDMFTFQPSSGRREVLDKPIGTDVSSMLLSDGKLYYSGYPSAPLCVYDPARPWTFGKDTPLVKAPDAESPQSNPRRLFYAGTPFRVHYGYYLARDAAGRIYMGCHGERHRVGGALAVYDPISRRMGGIGEPQLTNFDVAGLAATSDGRRIVYSSRVVKDPLKPDATPIEAKLFVYDPDAGRFVHEFAPLPGRASTGVLASGAPGQVIGASPAPRGSGITLYAADVASGRVIYQRDVPGAIAGSFRPGPDGQIWTFLDGVLVRIAPGTGAVTPVGKVASGPGDFIFVGRDLYLAGRNSLRRIRGVLPSTRARTPR